MKEKPGEVKLWDLADGKVIREFAGHAGAVYCLALTPDGKTLATASHDQTVRLWDVDAAKVKFTLAGHKQPVRTVAFSPSGLTVVSASNADLTLVGPAVKPDSSLIFWDVTERTRAGLDVRGVLAQELRLRGQRRGGHGAGGVRHPGRVQPAGGTALAAWAAPGDARGRGRSRRVAVARPGNPAHPTVVGPRSL